MTNPEAVKRITEKIRYSRQLIVERPDDKRANCFRELDIDAFELALAALEYVEQMRLYEESQQIPR